MDITLIGYGKMGREIEQVALNRGHHIVAKLDAPWEQLPECDVAIEFTQPSSAPDNIIQALKQGTPIVSGTTGWLDRWNEVADAVAKYNGTLFYASNYSVGLYLFRQVNQQLAHLMAKYRNFEPSLEEIHHIHKLDYPSGTALTLAEEILEQLPQKNEVVAFLAPEESPKHTPEQLLIRSVREGEVPGTHIIKYDSAEEEIIIEHKAKGRVALALGALLAAEYIRGKKGLYGMEHLVNLNQ